MQQQLQEAQNSLERIQLVSAEQIQSAQATLHSLTNVPPVDVELAEAELYNALAKLEQAKVSLDALSVRSPINGQLLSINTNLGERVGSRGLATLGQTQQMFVVAEVHESDIRYVQAGQNVTITSESNGFEGELHGQVSRIGLQIEKPGLINDDPIAQTDVRVTAVEIKLNPDDSERVKTLNNMKVLAAIDI